MNDADLYLKEGGGLWHDARDPDLRLQWEGDGLKL